MKDEIMFQALELVASTFPWDKVRLSVERQPEGICSFTFWLDTNDETGAKYAFGCGNSPEEAAKNLIREAGDRDPNKARERKILELEMQIQKLKTKSYILPPYRAPGQLGFGEEPKRQRTPPAPLFTNIESESVPL